MTKVGIFILVAVILIAILGSVAYQRYKPSPEVETQIQQISETKSFVPFSARFMIYTNGTKRIFTDSKYHNRSQDVYITLEDPSLIQVKKEGTTWQEFFDTLPAPMKVTKNCLYTGSGQTFCSNETSKLLFFINGNVEPNVLEKEINPNDQLMITFGNLSEEEIKSELSDF
jgi:hypothetical protein